MKRKKTLNLQFFIEKWSEMWDSKYSKMKNDFWSGTFENYTGR